MGLVTAVAVCHGLTRHGRVGIGWARRFRLDTTRLGPAWKGTAVTVFNYNKESEMYFSRKTKQRIIDDYLNETGKDRFIPEEFINWLERHNTSPRRNVVSPAKRDDSTRSEPLNTS